MTKKLELDESKKNIAYYTHSITGAKDSRW